MKMVSKVEIANMALGNIRGGTISSFTEGSVQANACNLKYDLLRDRMLTEAPWGFNRRVRALSLLTTELFNFAYVYQYPIDCLKIERLIGSWEEISTATSGVISRVRDEELLSLSSLRTKIPYDVFNEDDNKVIGANEPDLRIDYALKITDPNLFSSDFTLALSHLLASEIAIPVIGAELGRALRKDELAIYNSYLTSALANDLNDQHDEPTESEFVTTRR